MTQIDFSVRPNKSIERKLMVECLTMLSKKFPISKYSYIGFGSFWFRDFLLFHKRLGISKMTSIERDDYAKRAVFNIPLRCISVEAGDSTLVLPHLDYTAKTLVWLDYDQTLQGEWRDDAEIALAKLPPGSIYVVTINAHHGQLKGIVDDDGAELSKIEALEYLVKDLMPPDTKPSDLGAQKFPGVVGDILIALFRRLVRKSNPNYGFEPIFNFRYADNAPMVTVGGMILDEETRPQFDDCNLQNVDFLTGDQQFPIDAPPLTIKEKQVLDKMLPKRTKIQISQVPSALRDAIPEAEVVGYQQFYKYYPVFAEFQE